MGVPRSLTRFRVGGFAPILVANLVPLVGVVRFGWEPATVVVIYALEVLCSFPIAGAKALFAQRPPQTDRDGLYGVSASELLDKRGRFSPVSWLPPIYPRSIPFAVTVVGAAAWCGIFIAVVLSRAVDLPAVLAQPEVLVSAGGLVAGQVVDTWRDYLRGGRYQTASPYSVIETPGRQAFFLAFALFVLQGVAGDPGRLLGVFVLLKLVVEWSAFRASHGAGGRLSAWLSGPDATAEEGDPPQVPDDEPDAVVDTDLRAVVSTAVLRTLARPAPLYASTFIMIWLASVAVVGGGSLPRSAVIGSLIVVCGLYVAALVVEVADLVLAYGPLEYRRHDDRIVAYDTWLDEPQWETPIGVLRDVAVVGDRLPDRLLDTRTVSLTTGWGDEETEREIGPVEEYDRLVEGFELPVAAELRPLNRGFTAATVVSAVGIVAAIVVAAVGPWEAASLVTVVFLLPFGVLVPRGLWWLAVPDTE